MQQMEAIMMSKVLLIPNTVSFPHWLFDNVPICDVLLSYSAFPNREEERGRLGSGEIAPDTRLDLPVSFITRTLGKVSGYNAASQE